MSKYAPLHAFLVSQRDVLTLSFAEVADLVGGLPASAYVWAPWWENEGSTHVQARAWLSAGFHAHPNLVERTVRFERT